MAKATLLVIQGVDQGARFELEEEAVGIGRGVGNQVRILDTEVSRRHAVLEPDNGRFLLTDRNSSNGTFVNGHPIRTQTLHNGDRIQIGRSVILFNTTPAESTGRPVAERIAFLGETEGGDHSRIISQVDPAVGSALAGQSSGTLVKPGGGEEADVLAQSLANLQVMYRISEDVVSPSISIDQLLKRILDLTIEVSGGDRGCILLADTQTEELHPRVFSHRRGVDVSSRMPVSRSIVDYVVKNGRGVRSSDARSDQRFEPGQSIVQAGIREALCAPMQGKYGLMGVVYVDTTTPPEQVILRGEPVHRFTEEQLRLLVAIGREAALAVENNRYQEALLKAERLAAIGQTIAMLSHHIKNILQGVRGGSYLIDMGLNQHDEELVRKGWGIVEKNQNKIYHMVMDMLTFSKERRPVPEEIKPGEVVSDVCELMHSRAEECGVELETAFADDLPVTTADAEGIHRAVLNIVTNAIDAAEGKEGGLVRVETGYQPESDRVYVAVTDNGEGIAEEEIPRLFQLFESSKGLRGTGLGLAVSQKIMREHGGEIQVESRPGEGSRFTLIWPRSEEEARSGEPEGTAGEE